jgi:hypothetical protein
LFVTAHSFCHLSHSQPTRAINRSHIRWSPLDVVLALLFIPQPHAVATASRRSVSVEQAYNRRRVFTNL